MSFQSHAIVVQKPGDAAKQEVSVPKLRDDYILVKVKAVALNPTDWKHVDFLTTKGARVSQATHHNRFFEREKSFLLKPKIDWL
jgi:NADPH:quinone reductase-like Zn-dependent oxidoreductase